MKPWCPEYEMEYVSGTSREELLSRHRKQYELFEVDRIVESADAVLEVGCGAAGGMLPVAGFGFHKWVSVDPLVSEYRRHGWLPPSQYVSAYAHDLGLLSDSFDVVFCLEALDHCESMEQFRQSQSELARVLKSGGVLFFMLPPRSKPRDGHPCCPGASEVSSHFESLGLSLGRSRFRNKEGIWHLYRKG